MLQFGSSKVPRDGSLCKLASKTLTISETADQVTVVVKKPENSSGYNFSIQALSEDSLTVNIFSEGGIKSATCLQRVNPDHPEECSMVYRHEYAMSTVRSDLTMDFSLTLLAKPFENHSDLLLPFSNTDVGRTVHITGNDVSVDG